MVIKTISSGSHGNAYSVKTPSMHLLIECGIRWTKIIKGLNFEIPDYCIISHEHGDHAKAALVVAKKGIPIICSHGTAKAIGLKTWQYSTSAPGIMLTPGVHDSEEHSIVIIDEQGERLVFATDTSLIPVNIVGITQLMIEVNYSKYTRQDDSEYAHKTDTHMSLETAVEWIKRQDMELLREIRAIHLSNQNSDENYIKTELQKFGKTVFVE